MPRQECLAPRQQVARDDVVLGLTRPPAALALRRILGLDSAGKHSVTYLGALKRAEPARVETTGSGRESERCSVSG